MPLFLAKNRSEITLGRFRVDFNILEVIKKEEGALFDGLDAAAAFIEHQIKALVPVKTGALKESIEVRVRGVFSFIPRMEVIMLPYGKYIEEGTISRGPQPFIRPVLVGMAPTWMRIVAEVSKSSV